MKTETVLCLGLWLAMAAIGWWGHVNLPDMPIADHFGLDGKPDGYHPRDIALAIGPLMALGFIILLLWVLPAIMPKKATPLLSVKPYGIIVVALVALFLCIETVLVLNATGLAVDTMRVITLGLGLFFVIVGNYLPKTRLNFVMGIRTPWTISDERVWDRTHRLAGPLFVLGGLVAVGASFLPAPALRMLVLISAITLPALVSVVYSYVVSRRLGLS